MSMLSAGSLLAWLLAFGPQVAVVTGMMLVYKIGVGACKPASTVKAMSVDLKPDRFGSGLVRLYSDGSRRTQHDARRARQQCGAGKQPGAPRRQCHQTGRVSLWPAQ